MVHAPRTTTPGGLFVVGGRPYVDSQTLHNLASTHQVSPVAGGWEILGPDGHAVLCLGTSCPPLPEQRGALYEARAARGVGLVDTCATWLAGGAARLAGKFDGFPTASSSAAGGCGCGVTCGCGPCRHRHTQARAEAGVPDEETAKLGEMSDGVTDEQAAQYVLDTVVFEVGDYMPETERREPSGFFLHLYLIDGENERKAATFEVEGRQSFKIVWMVQPTSSSLRSKLAAVVDRLVQEAYDKENHRDSE
jgi:hypothetical protein